MLGNFPPFTTMQELNLDWILTKIKNILRFVPDDGAVGQILRRTPSGAEWSNEQGGGAVNSVNGQTGDVILDAADVGALPDTYVAPVTSVNGQTGAVSLSIPGSTSDLVNDSGFVNAAGAAAAAPVQSVNGQTGVVVIPTGTPLDAYPVGAIYMSVNSTSPSTLFGGTWERLKDRFLLGAGDTYTAGDTGGEAAHTLTESEMPSHDHPITTGYDAATSASGGTSYLVAGFSGTAHPVNMPFRIGNRGGGQAHNNMPPYLVVYMWKRTA